ncbi:MAG: DMT family transporter [Psychromonas sp.]
MSQRKILFFAFLGLVLTNLFWAINAILAKGYVGEIPPVAMNTIRWFGAFILLTPFAFPRIVKNWAVIRANAIPLFGLALLAISLYNSLLYISANFTSAINITLINTLIPVFTSLIAWKLLDNRPRTSQVVGLIMSILGVLVILTQGNLYSLLTLSFSLGDLIMLTAVTCWALFTVLLKKLELRLSPITLLYSLIALGLPFLIIAMVIEMYIYRLYIPSLSQIPVFAYLWVFPSILAYVFWTNGVQRLGPEAASLSIILMPLFGTFLAITFLGESIFWFHIVGGVCSLMGIVLALSPAKWFSYLKISLQR